MQSQLLNRQVSMYVAIAVFLFSLPVILCIGAVMRGRWTSDSQSKKGRWLALASVAAAWFLGLIFVGGGMSKLMPFPGLMGPVWLEEKLAVYDLGLYARFIAWSEAVIGILLLARATRVLGSIMMVPLLVNILMVVVSMNWRGTPWIIGFFLEVNLFLLVYYFDYWKSIILPCQGPCKNDTRENDNAPRPWIGLVCMASILAGPLWFAIHPAVAVTVIVAGFLGLIGLEWQSRFQ